MTESRDVGVEHEHVAAEAGSLSDAPDLCEHVAAEDGNGSDTPGLGEHVAAGNGNDSPGWGEHVAAEAGNGSDAPGWREHVFDVKEDGQKSRPVQSRRRNRVHPLYFGPKISRNAFEASPTKCRVDKTSATSGGCYKMFTKSLPFGFGGEKRN
jgi:hypothetical protein